MLVLQKLHQKLLLLHLVLQAQLPLLLQLLPPQLLQLGGTTIGGGAQREHGRLLRLRLLPRAAEGGLLQKRLRGLQMLPLPWALLAATSPPEVLHCAEDQADLVAALLLPRVCHMEAHEVVCAAGQ